MEAQLITELAEKSFIPETDIKIILDCVSAFPNNDIFAHKNFLERVFLTDIKPGHFLVLGYLIGYLSATENALKNFYQNLSLCQRQN